ncbi:transcription initiation factor IIF [Apiospora rasikravindrae]|uniref:Transcription initiation factor IIF n=1 Tax=Apiospora rasikravindrae TaxID=990691 RepID=A0ABR1T649_9PEZI
MSIFLDFDGTITVQDTIGEVANFALRVRADEGEDLSQAWGGVVRSYMDDYRGHVDGYRVEEGQRICAEDEVGFLREMKTVELRSLGRIRQCGVFRDIAPERFYEAGRRAVEEEGTVQLRPGFLEFVRTRLAEGWKLWVVSVNWSAAFIAGALGCPEINVIANTVRSDGSISGPDILNQSGSGAEHRNLTNSCDKLAVVDAVLQQQAASLQGKPSFYFGDSITDLECLLRTDYGVVISDKEDSTLLKTLGRIGKKVSHSTDTGAKDSLSWASNYNDVEKHVAFKL